MKHLFFSILMFVSFLAFPDSKTSLGKTSLSGKISDKTTGEALIGVYIYIPDLKTGTASNLDGTYKIDNLPQTKVLVKVSALGYKTILETIDLALTTKRDFVLEESTIDIQEVVITGMSKSTEIKRDPVPIVAIDRKEMDQNLSTNVIDAIAKLPGVSEVTTGPNVSKPFIRGLGYNRVLTLFDGVRQEGQQWGDEHGIEVDDNAVDRIEVVKGPASLTYGSDALAGVVNLLPPLPVPEGTVKGDVVTNYQSNNGLYEGSGSLAGNTNGLIWGGRTTYKEATNYQDKYDGRVYGTGFHEGDANAYVGLNKQWGYSHLNFTAFDALQEIPDGSRDSATRQFTKQITEADLFRPIVSPSELNSYQIPVLHQHVQHYRIYSTSNFIVGKSKLAVTLGYQQSIRQEYSHPQAPDIAGLDLFLQSYTYDLKYYLPEYNGWETTLGLNGMYQTNKNEGTEFIIPDYSLFDFGPFALVKRSIGKLDLSGGVRYDQRSFNNSEMYTKTNPVTGFDMQTADTTGAKRVFSGYAHTFSGVSGSFGGSYNFSDNFLIKTNIARGYRAPNIAELSANGVHPGTDIYQIGNANFQPEFSLQEDLGAYFSSKHISGDIDFFNNDIQNYIYNQKVLNHHGTDSIIVPGNETFQYQAAHAELYGCEFSLDIHPHPWDWLHFENSLSIIYALNKGVNGTPVSDSAKYLPLIPPLHTNSELRANIPKKWKYFSSIYVKVGMQCWAAQDRAYLAYNTETKTPGYTLFDAGLGADVNGRKGKKLFSIHIAGTNITDVAYQSNMSRLKYMDNYPDNGTGRSGIYNMGRNISFKLIVPLDLRKPKAA